MESILLGHTGILKILIDIHIYCLLEELTYLQLNTGTFYQHSFEIFLLIATNIDI